MTPSPQPSPHETTLAELLQHEYGRELREQGVDIDPAILHDASVIVAHTLHLHATGRHEAIKELVSSYQAPKSKDLERDIPIEHISSVTDRIQRDARAALPHPDLPEDPK